MQQIISDTQLQQLKDSGYSRLDNVMQNAYDRVVQRHMKGGKATRAIAASLNLPAPDYKKFKAELLAAPSDININYSYLGARIVHTMRLDDMCLQKDGRKEDIFIRPLAAMDLERYITTTYRRRAKKEISPDEFNPFFSPLPEPRARTSSHAEHVEGERTGPSRKILESREALKRFQNGFDERGEIPARKLSTLAVQEGIAKNKAHYIIERIGEALRGNGVYNAIKLNPLDFHKMKDDLWVGGGSRETIQNYFTGLHESSTAQQAQHASFVSGGLPGQGKRR